MAARELTRLEQVGILAAIVVIGTFLYLKFIHHDTGRKFKRTKREYEKVALEVDRLRVEARTGRERREISRLRKQLSKARSQLEKAEILLAQDDEKIRAANTIVKTAAESGLMIKTFGEITEKKAVGDFADGKTPYSHKYYRISLKGRFQDLHRFLKKINDFPKLIAVRKITIEKIQEEAYIRSTLWISI